MYCLQCGTQLPDEASFCNRCGKPACSSTSLSNSATGGTSVFELSCPSCGGALSVSADANRFDCRYCGKGLVVLRQQHQVQVQLAPTVVCELRLKAPIKNIFIGRVWTVEALAYYSEGPRIVDTATFKCDPMMAEVVITQRSAQDAVDRIVASLTGDGWQMAGSGHLGLPRFERTGKAPETSSRQSATACERKDIVVNLGVIASTPGGSGITKFHALRTTAQKAAAEANPEIRRAVEAEAVGGWEPEGDVDLLALHLAGKVRSRSLWGGMMTWKFSFDSATVSLRRASSAARLSSDY